MSLNNSQYEIIQHKFEEIQQVNKSREIKRREFAYKKIPKIKEIDEQIAQNSIRYAKYSLLKSYTNLSNLKLENDRLIFKKHELLRKYNLQPNYLDHIYNCPICKDTGYIGNTNKKCNCFNKFVIDLLYKQSNIRKKLEIQNFNTLDLNYYSTENIEDNTTNQKSPYENMKYIVNKCKEFTKNFDKNNENILITGKTGLGKTFLTNCIAKEILDSGHTIIYLSAFQLFQILENKSFSKENEEKEEADSTFNYILDCDLLIVDDLGTELNNSFTNSQLFLCMNERILRNKSTVISTNLSIENLKDTYSDRVFSRFIGYYNIYSIYGQDIRAILKRQNIKPTL